MKCNVICTVLHPALFNKHCENDAMLGKNVCKGHYKCGQALNRYDDEIERIMAHTDKKSGTKSPEWWKHLRKEKRTFWKKVRKAVKEMIRGNQD